MSRLALVRAFVRRDFRIERSYRAAVAGQVLGGLLFLATFGVISPIVRSDFDSQFGTSYFAFVATGIAVTGALLAALQSFASSLRDAQLEGTLEGMLLAPVPNEDVVACMGAWPLLVGFGFTTLTITAAWIAGARLSVNWISLGLTAAASLAAFAGLGLIAAAGVMVAKRGNPVATLVGMAGSLSAGAYAPTSTFPGWLRAVASANPMTYALRAWRGALLDARPPADLAGSLAVLAGLAVVALPVSRWALRRALAAARRDGTLATY